MPSNTAAPRPYKAIVISDGADVQQRSAEFVDVQHVRPYRGSVTDGGMSVTQQRPEIDTEDAEAIAAYDAALRDFTIELNRLHIASGAPSYAAIAKASVRPKLTKAGINEALSGKRLPSIDSLMEFVRVVSSAPADAPAPRCEPKLAEAWKARWQEVKFAQRRAHAPWRRLRDTVREPLMRRTAKHRPYGQRPTRRPNASFRWPDTRRALSRSQGLMRL